MNGTTVRIPNALVERYDRLSNRDSWLNFSDFVREAVRRELQRQEEWNAKQIEEREE